MQRLDITNSAVYSVLSLTCFGSFGYNLRVPIHWNILVSHRVKVDRDRVVGIKTRYGLNDPGNESRWGRVFRHPPRPAPRPTQPPVQLMTYLFPAGKEARAWR
jgi:hypothetical protein